MIFILYPHQLFFDIRNFFDKKVVLVEEPLFFTQYIFHVQKLVLHRASMKFYEEYLRRHDIDVEYCEDESYLARYKGENIFIFDVVDSYLFQKIQRNFANLTVLKNPNFLNTEDETKFLHNFYIHRRKECGILLDAAEKPLGGKWSFDAMNRKKLPKEITIPPVLSFDNNYVQEAKRYVRKFQSVGDCDDFHYPSTFSEAHILLEDFLYKKFYAFGEYQDALSKEDSFLFHSNLSSSLNIGLLDLHYVIEKILSYKDVPLSAKEGLIRQIIGWREFMLRLYKDDGVRLRNANFFDAKHIIPQAILKGNTGLEPLDDIIAKVKKNAYAHHIERLMILGNIFTLLEIDPNAVHSYFMAHFIDAYDWVMVGNVYVMSGFCDGGTITTKPYIASSNYILKMSNYKKRAWSVIMDALYWSFLQKHAAKLRTNTRMQMQLALLDKMDPSKLQKHTQAAREFKQSIGLYEIKEEDTNRLIEMAWQDRLPFDIIQKQYGLSENQLKNKMRSLISKKAYKRWRERVQGRKTKHIQKLDHKPDRFQGPW